MLFTLLGIIKNFFPGRIKLDYAAGFLWLLAIGLRVSHFGSVPGGYQVDELGSAYDAWCLLNYGTDRYGLSYPAYFINFGGGQSALYTYLCAVSISILGFNSIAIRLPALLVSLLLAVCGLKTIGLIWPGHGLMRAAYAKLLFLTLYAVSPYTFMASRFGLDCNFMLGIATAFLYFLLRAVNERRPWLFAVSGLWAGLLLYTYAIAYLVLPLFLILALVYLIYLRRVSWREVLLLATPLAVMAMPLILVQVTNMLGKETWQFGFISIVKLTRYRVGEFTTDNMAENLAWVLKSVLAFDWYDYNTNPRFWTFYPLSAFFATIGFARALRTFALAIDHRAWQGSNLIMLWFLAELAIGSLLGQSGHLGDQANTNKMNGIFFPVMLFIVWGIGYSFRGWRAMRWKKAVASVVSIVYLVSIFNFFDFYFKKFQPQFATGYTYQEVLVFVKSNPRLAECPLLVEAPPKVVHDAAYIYYLASVLPAPCEVAAGSKAYGQVGMVKDMAPVDMPPRALYLCPKEKADTREAFQAAGFFAQEFRHFFLLIPKALL